MHVPVNRPSWKDFFLGLAKVVSRRSLDARTKHGCVIASADNRVLSLGYNSLPAGMKDDTAFPNFDVGKYPFMSHAEVSAVSKANGPLAGGVAYVTGASCLTCMINLWQHGVKHIVEVDGHGWLRDGEEAENKQLFLDQSGMRVERLSPDLSWLVDMVLADDKLRQMVRERLSAG